MANVASRVFFVYILAKAKREINLLHPLAYFGRDYLKKGILTEVLAQNHKI